jgi:hypothetical protein
LRGDTGRQLYYDPIGRRGQDGEESDAFFRDVADQGRVLGSNSLFCGAILAALIPEFVREEGVFSTKTLLAAEWIGKGIQDAICNVQTLYTEGYGPAMRAGKKPPCWGVDRPTGKTARPARRNHLHEALVLRYPVGNLLKYPTAEKSRKKHIGWATILQTPRWNLLEEDARHLLYPLACKIVVDGLEKALNVVPEYEGTRDSRGQTTVLHRSKRIVAPVVHFGDYVTVEREEIEDLRNIDAILRAYHLRASRDKNHAEQETAADRRGELPVSIAVFGPPGSGKSSGVESVAKAIFGKRVEFIKCNLAQLSSPTELVTTLLRIKDSDRVRFLFVDEFDSPLQKEPFGWLRYFLALMEDGEFKHGEQILHIRNAILVFAGGTFQSFQDFAGQSTASSDEKRLEFARAKGPDFVSRLAGHINMIGVNPRDEHDSGYVIRRALRLRALLKKRKLVGHSDIAMIPPALIEALLRAPLYKHGSRSLRIVLDTCVSSGGKIWLPTLAQLDMHVDAEQLMELYEEALRHPTILRNKPDGLIVTFGDS